MPDINQELLLQSVNKEGFNLQSKVQKIFQEKGFTCKQEFTPTGSYCSPIDIFAYPPSGRSEFYSIFVVECKGDAPNSAICLFDKSHDFIREAPLMHQGIMYRPLSKLKYRIDKGFRYYNPNPVHEKGLWICEKKLPISFRYCHTGYFFKSPNYKKSNDDKDNLFKAIKNISKSIPTLGKEIQRIINSSEIGKELLEINIFPLILTNVKIFVNISDQENMEVDWAVYNPGTNLEPAINPAGINDFFVTNLDALPEFIKKFS